jgi:hypothetical protein
VCNENIVIYSLSMYCIFFSPYIFSEPLQQNLKKNILDNAFVHKQTTIVDENTIKEKLILWPHVLERYKKDKDHEKAQEICNDCMYDRYVQLLILRAQKLGQHAINYTPGNVKELWFILYGELPETVAEIPKEKLVEAFFLFNQLMRCNSQPLAEAEQVSMKRDVLNEYYQLLAEEEIKLKICAALLKKSEFVQPTVTHSP